MPPLRLFPHLLALLLPAMLLTGCSSSSSPPDAAATTTQPPPTSSPNIPTLPKCKLPKEIDFPRWVPDDLPLPDGTYASQHLSSTAGYSRGLFVIPVTTTDFAKFVLKKWPGAGYQLGRGDAEPGEVEDQFLKSPAFGAFKAQDMVCTPPHSIMLLIYVPDRSKLPAISTQPSSPLPGKSSSPSPSPSPS